MATLWQADAIGEVIIMGTRSVNLHAVINVKRFITKRINAPIAPKYAAARPQPRDYGLALTATLAGLVLRYLMTPFFGHQGPYLILTVPVVLAAFYGGFGPALLATVLGTSIGTYLFVSDAAGLKQILKLENISRTVLFFVIGLSIAAIGGRLRASRHALGETVQLLRASNCAKDNAMATLGH